MGSGLVCDPQLLKKTEGLTPVLGESNQIQYQPFHSLLAKDSGADAAFSLQDSAVRDSGINAWATKAKLPSQRA